MISVYGCDSLLAWGDVYCYMRLIDNTVGEVTVRYSWMIHMSNDNYLPT